MRGRGHLAVSTRGTGAWPAHGVQPLAPHSDQWGCGPNFTAAPQILHRFLLGQLQPGASQGGCGTQTRKPCTGPCLLSPPQGPFPGRQQDLKLASSR